MGFPPLNIAYQEAFRLVEQYRQDTVGTQRARQDMKKGTAAVAAVPGHSDFKTYFLPPLAAMAASIWA